MEEKDIQAFLEFLEQIDTSEFGMGKGITITTGFDVVSQKPLDARTVVRDLDELANIPHGMIYLGLTSFVISENKLYQWKVLKDEETGEFKEGWGAVEAEVAAREYKEDDEKNAVDFGNTPAMVMQKSKKDFFPVTIDDNVFTSEGLSLPKKYQTIVEENITTNEKTIPGAINELVTGLNDLDNEMTQHVNDILRLVDNTILDNYQCMDLMNQILANLELLDGTYIPSIEGTSFRVYKSSVEINEPATEISLSSLRIDVTMADKLFVHINSTYLTEGVDYLINYDKQCIVNITGNEWNEFNDSECQIAFDLFRFIENEETEEAIETYDDGVTTFSTRAMPRNTSRHYMATKSIYNETVTEVSFEDLGVTVENGDILFVHVNSVYLTENVDYGINYNNQSIVCFNESWSATEENACEFTFDLIKK